jgi:hypothetical protein
MSLEGKVRDSDIEHILDDVVKEVTLNIHTKAVDNIIEAGHVDTGELIQSSGFEFKEGVGYVYFSAPHAPPTEYGSRPHYPPIKPLIGWARRKLGLSDKNAKSVAYAIQHKIAKEGTYPMRYLRNAIDTETSER